jgi:hypothetical protein
MSQRSDISASIQANFPDNTSQFITPGRLRSEQGLFEQYSVLSEQTASIIAQAVASSSASPVDTGSLVTTASFNAYTASTNTFTGSIQTQVNALRAATSSYVTNAQTASMSVLSASYASSSTSASFALTASFALNAGTTVDTGSFVTTSSFNAYTASTNTFTGSIQTQVNTLQSATASYVTNAQTGSFVTSAITGSSVITASVALNTITFTKGDGSTFPITVNTGSAFPFTGSAQISGSLTITNDTDGVIFDIKQPSHTTESIYSMRMGPQADVTESLAVGGNLLLSGSFNNTYRIVIPTTIDNATLTGSLAGTASWANNSVNSIATASVSLNTITFTKGDASTFAVTVNTGSGGGMNLGANTFTGSQTLSSSTIPASLIFNVSGALASFVTESNAIGTTNTGYGNVIFNARTTAANTGSVIISGSSNIIFDAGTTLTTPRGLQGLQNIGFAPVYSGSIPAFNQNYLVGTLTASGSKISILGNNINGTVTLTENNAASGALNNNIINAGQVVISLNYSGSTGLFGNSINNNNINGNQHLIQIIGSGSQNRQFVGNTIGGQSITASLTTPTGSSNNSGSLLNTFIYGVGLIVSGTQINTNTLHGGAFIGRYNETASVPADNTIVFAVGAGTSNTARKTALFVKGTGETIIAAAGGGENARANSVFGIDYVKIGQNTVNANTTIAQYNGSFMTNGGSIAAGVGNVLIGGGVNTITNGRDSVMLGSSYSTINTLSGGAEAHNVIVGAQSSVISGSRSRFTGIYSSYASSISQSIQSAIIAGNFTSLNDTTSSVALGRDTAYTGSANYTLFTQNIQASGSVAITGSFSYNGNRQFNYGEFWMSSSSTPSAGVSQSVVFDSTGHSVGVAISGSAGQIKITNGGTYNIQFSAQINCSAGADTMWMWFKKNGTNIAASNSKAVLANNTAQLITVNILDTATANDYYEIVYQNNAGNAQILSEAASGNYPSIPGVILTVTQVA